MKMNIINAMRDVWARDPVLGAILTRLDVRHVSGEDAIAECPTMKTNGRALVINDDWAGKLTRNQLGLVLAHEALHVARGHNVRRGTFDHDTWNRAADAAINHELRGWPAYEFAENHGTTARKLGLPEGQDAQTYATALKARATGQQQEDDDGTDGTGRGADSETDEAEKGTETADGEGANGSEDQTSPETPLGNDPGIEPENDEDAPRNVVIPKTGTYTGGDPDDVPRGVYDVPRGTPAGMPEDDVQDHPEPNTARAQAEQENMILQAIETASACGSLPGWAEELRVRITAAPKLNWRVLLRQWLTRRARVRRSFERPSRRAAMMKSPLIQPGRGGRKIGKLAFLVDVSGSMYVYQDKLDQAVAEIATLIETMPDTDVRVIQWDVGVRSVADFHGTAPKTEWKWTGRGGTYIVPALQAAKEWQADVQVIWTDGEFGFPERVEVPTLWCLTRPTMVGRHLGEALMV